MKKSLPTLIFISIIVLFSLYGIYFFAPLSINKITYNVVDNDIIATIKLRGNSLYGNCIYENNSYEIRHNVCEIKLSNNPNPTVTLKNLYGEKNYTLNPNIDYIVDFGLDYTKTYLVLKEKKEIKVNSIKSIGAPNKSLTITSEDPSIVNIKKNYMIGKKAGETNVIVKIGDIQKKIKVVVTDLVTMPTYNEKRKVLACHEYTEKEAKLLDNLLEYRVKEAGYSTRAGAVAAARFLTLEFKYRIQYFYENGRVSNTGQHFVDGEGRYYKKGLYLSESKKKKIIASWTGPAIWGCPLKNLEDEKQFGYYAGKMVSNGLDCSGFVSWALYQGGFDPGDNGAGETPDVDVQMTDLGEYTKLTKEIIKSNKIKVGDLFNYWGHIAMLVGIDGDNYYVAESLPNFDGVVARKYTKSNIMSTFTHVVFMDKYYKEDGNLTEYFK